MTEHQNQLTEHYALTKTFQGYLSLVKPIMYCHRKFRPLTNIRLCYNDNLYLKGAFRWRNAENSLLSLKQKLCLKPSTVKLHKQNCVDVITSAKNRSQRGNANFLKMLKPSLSLQISRQASQRSGSLNSSNSLVG